MEWLVPTLISVIGAGGGAFGKMAYRQIIDALERTRTSNDALAKRVICYERINSGQHGEILERLSHVEALVNGKGGSR